jgi:hypothetical protein
MVTEISLQIAEREAEKQAKAVSVR